MYEVVDNGIKEIALIYIVFMSASLLTFPIVKLIINAVGRGSERWK